MSHDIEGISSARSVTAELGQLFPGESEMAGRMRAFDWAASDLGSPTRWPEHLRVAVRLCLTSRFPLFLWWGSGLTMLYNDACIAFLGKDRHPRMLGRSGREAWSEIWDTIGPLYDAVVTTGIASKSEDLLMFFERGLPLEEVYVTFSYSPILGEGRHVDGIFCACTETTTKVITNRRLETLRRLAIHATEARTVEVACQEAVAVLGENERDIPFSAIYVVDTPQEKAILCGTMLPPVEHHLPTSVTISQDDAHASWPLATALRTRRAAECADLGGHDVQLSAGPWPEPPHRALIVPILASQDHLSGVLVVGVSPRRPLDDEYRTFFDLVAGHIATAIADAREATSVAVPANAFVEEASIEGLEAGADDFLIKPFYARELVASVRSHIVLARVRQEAEATLRESEEPFRALADAAPIGIYQTDAEGRVVYTNARWQALSGLSAQESLGYGWNRAVHPEDRDRVLEEYLEATRAGREFYIECRMISTTGETRWVIGRAAPIVSADGKLTGYVGTVEDITDRKQAEEALQASEGRYRQLSQNLEALNEELERRVQQRTAKLAETVDALHAEAAERGQADRSSRGQAETLMRTLEQLTKNHPLRALPGIVLAAITEQLGAVSSILELLDRDAGVARVELIYQDGHIVSAAEAGYPTSTTPLQERRDHPGWRRVVEECRPVAHDVSTSTLMPPGIRDDMVERGVRQLVMVPLALGEDVIGVFSARLTDSEVVSPDKIALAQALGHQATLAIHLSRLTEQARQTAVLEERNRMAREIHDTLAQAFTGILMQLGAAERLLGDYLSPAEAHLQSIRDLAREGLAEARRSVQALRPQALEETDLAGALKRLAQQLDAGKAEAEHTPVLQFLLRGEPRPLPPDAADQLLRIRQESLTNALRHADATMIRVELAFGGDEVRLVVQDDGRGLVAGPPERAGGFGLRGMRERAGILGATLTITGQPNQGTRVDVQWRMART